MKFDKLYDFIMSEEANRDFWPPVHDDYSRAVKQDPGIAADPEIDHVPVIPSDDTEDELIDPDDLDETILKKVVVRGGIKKKVKTSTKTGYKMQGNREVKMDPQEFKARKKGGKRAAKKVKHLKGQIMKKRAKSMNRRKSV